MLYDPIKKLSNIHNKMQDALAATERIEELLGSKPTITSGDKILSQAKDIFFDNVSLRYDDKIALDNITLKANKSKVYALVGDSGAGKSSFINLLVRFYDVSSGAVYINGTDIRQYSLESLHSQIAYVTQRIYIFQDTIAANVAYGTTIDRDRVIQALRLANAWDFVSTLDDGIDTMLDEFGHNLSGGQRQRIALARALYKKPSVLILDEATSALDNKSEQAIQQSLELIKDELITFVVAHRLSTIENADEILVFRDGKIVDRGTYSQLLQNSDEFRKLAKK
jgi:subfamily B ATP-binding cassette protein MsbA